MNEEDIKNLKQMNKNITKRKWKEQQINFPTSSDVKKHKITETVKERFHSTRSPRAGPTLKSKDTYVGKPFNIPTNTFGLFRRNKK